MAGSAKRRIALALAVMCAVTAVTAGVAAEADPGTLYVRNGVPGGGDGSAAAPFRTIQEAVDVAQPGDTVDVGPGRYGGFTTVRSGEPEAPIVLRGHSDALGDPDSAIVGVGDERLVNFHHDYITFRGFDVRGGDIDIWVGSPVAGDHTTGVRLLDNFVHNANGECIRLKYFSIENEVAGNRIDRCGLTGFDLGAGSKNGEGIYIGTAPEQLYKNPTPEPDASNGNSIHDNVITPKAECVEMKEAASFNTVADNTCSGARDPDGAGFSSRGDHNLFTGNSSTGNRGDGIRLGGDEKTDGRYNDVIGNTLSDNRGYAVDVERKPQGTVCGNTATGNRKGVTNRGGDPTAPC